MTVALNNGLNQTLTVINQTDCPIVFATVKDDLDSGLDAYAQQLTPVSSVIPAKTGQGSFSLNLDGVSNYNLIGMQADNLFPVANRVAIFPVDCSHQPSAKCGNGTTSYYEDLTISQAEADAMQQSFRFYQNVLAYPETDSVIAFVKLLANYQNDPLNTEKAINDFFQQTQGYTQCTLASYIAASSYCRYYAFAWANLQNDFTYLVFQPATDPNATEGFVTIGKVVFTQKTNAPNPADINDRNGGFNIIYQPNTGNSHPLKLEGGRLINADSNASPAVSLLLSYGLKSDFTGVDTDNVAWPILAGKADGREVVAIGVPADSPAAQTGQSNLLQGSSWKGKTWTQLFSPKTAADWAEVVGLMVGLAMAVGLFAFTVYQVVTKLREFNARAGRPATPQESQDIVDAANNARKRYAVVEGESFSESFDESSSVFFAGADGFKIDFETSTQSIRTERLQELVERQKISFDDLLDSEQAIVNTISKYGTNSSLEEARIRISQAKTTVAGIKDFAGLKQVREALLTNLADIRQIVTTQVKASSETLSSREKGVIDDTELSIEEQFEFAQKAQVNAEKIAEGETPIEE